MAAKNLQQTKLDLRLNFYFGLSKNAQRRFNSLGYNYNSLEEVPRQDILRITKSRQLIALYDELIASSNVIVLVTPERTREIQPSTRILYIDFKARTLVSSLTVYNREV